MGKTVISIATLLAISSVPAMAATSRDVSVPRCISSHISTIVANVERDYMQNRITSWKEDRKVLGQRDPVVWVDAKEVRRDGDVWEVPLTIRGELADIHYDVTVDCKKGVATYRN